MGKKAKKRLKSAPTPSLRVIDPGRPLDIMQDEDENLLDIKRLKETRSLEFGDLGCSDHEGLSLSDDLDVTGDDVLTYQHKAPCHSDSDLMNNDIFDEIHSNLGEFGSSFLSGMDAESILDVKHDHPPSPVVIEPSASLCHMREVQTTSTNTTEGPVVIPTEPAPSLLPAQLPSTSTVNMLPGGLPMSPLLLPNVVGGTGAATTALAHISKIEPGADGKGYVLYLTIPALGLSNVMLSTEGLTFAHNEPKHPVGGVVSGEDSGDDQCHQSPADDDDTDSPDEINVDTDSPSPLSYPSDDNPMTDSSPDLGLCELQGGGEVGFGVDALIDMDVVHGDNVPGQLSPVECSVPETDSLDLDIKLTSVEQNSVDKCEVDRFVICSDGPMVCVLCAFNTDSYSAFKSHIICSHPCWRITKKLSKNRLLVEKSVKINTGLTQNTVNMPASLNVRKQGQNTTGADADEPEHKEQDVVTDNQSPAFSSGSKTSNKRPAVHPRKKHLIERNKRLFRCTKCLRLFVFEGSIVNHLNDFHNISKPYDYMMVSNDHGRSFGSIHRCAQENCFVTCGSEEEVEKHRLNSHTQLVFRCQICGLAADNAQDIQTHVANIHQQQVTDYPIND